MDIQSLTTLYILVMNILLTLTIVKVLRINKADTKTQMTAYGIFFTWIGVELLLLGSNSIFPADISSMSMFIIILVGVAFTGVILAPIMKQLLALPQYFLLLPQGVRMFFGAGFVAEAAFGILPLNYGVMDGVSHITSAFLATTLAVYIAHGFRPQKSLIIINILGLLDIVVVAFGISFFILNDIGVEHNVFFAVFFPAPIFIWLHIISLYKYYLESKEENNIQRK